jgi:hypothetical protein
MANLVKKDQKNRKLNQVMLLVVAVHRWSRHPGSILRNLASITITPPRQHPDECGFRDGRGADGEGRGAHVAYLCAFAVGLR